MKNSKDQSKTNLASHKKAMLGMRHAIALAAMIPAPLAADPSLECSIANGSQVEIGTCVAEMETRVDRAIEVALGFAGDRAAEIDEATGRAVTGPALDQSQVAWSAYREAHCEFVGSTFGGGSGTGIAIRSCRVELGRARVRDLMEQAR